jgi:hypothetical protein
VLLLKITRKYDRDLQFLTQFCPTKNFKAMKKTILYGAIAGLLVTGVMLTGMAMIYDTDSAGSMVFGYTTMLVGFSLIFVNIKVSRDKNGGIISFGKAFKIGFGITLIASAIYVMGWMIEYYVFFPDFYDKCEIHQVAKLKAAGAPLAQVQAKSQEYEQLKKLIHNPLVHAFMTLIEIFPVGVLVSLVAALILKRKPGQESGVLASPVSQ